MAIPPHPAPFLLRPARSSDAPQLATLSGQLGYPSTPEEVARRLREIQAGAEHAIFVAEQPGGMIAGVLDVFVMRTIESDPRVEVAGLVVEEDFRSKGVGALLMERAEEWARERGCRMIGLRSNVIRERAHAFYERLGYRVIKTQKAFRKTL